MKGKERNKKIHTLNKAYKKVIACLILVAMLVAYIIPYKNIKAYNIKIENDVMLVEKKADSDSLIWLGDSRIYIPKETRYIISDNVEILEDILVQCFFSYWRADAGNLDERIGKIYGHDQYILILPEKYFTWARYNVKSFNFTGLNLSKLTTLSNLKDIWTGLESLTFNSCQIDSLGVLQIIDKNDVQHISLLGNTVYAHTQQEYTQIYNIIEKVIYNYNISGEKNIITNPK